ncbi:MAG: rod shape-determining protein MreC [Armatimonadetes bacterium]|nr:rod shape-determining protein MreC [Armatimonadota bacterium]
MFVRVHWETYVLLFFLSAFLVFVQVHVTANQLMNPVEGALETVMAPIQKIFGWITRGASGLFSDLFPREDSESIESLKARLSLYATEIEKLKDQGYENERLRSLLTFRSRIAKKTIPAEVVGRDPTRWFHTVLIDKGSSHGITKDMIVLTPGGLVGRIFQVSPFVSRVLLILDPDSAVPAQIAEGRTLGIVFGQGGDQCIMKYIAHDAPIKEKDTIVSSGMGELFPKGTPIGRVSAVIKKEDVLFKMARIRPLVDFAAIESVLVVER